MSKRTLVKLPEPVEKRVDVLDKHLECLAAQERFGLCKADFDEAHQCFLIRCWELSLHYIDGAANMGTFLYSHTKYEAENFLRSIRRKSIAALPMQSLTNEMGEECIEDSNADFVKSIMFKEALQQLGQSLTNCEARLAEALDECNGNVAQAARILGIDESKARRMRKSLAKKCDFLKKE